MSVPPYATGYQAPRKRKRWPWVVGILAVLMFVFVGCAVVVGSAANTAAKQVAPSVPSIAKDSTVTYVIEGKGSATTVTYSTPDGQEQVQSVKLPWRKDVPVPAGKFTVPVLSAQNAGSGDLTCRILVDNEQTAKSTSSGQYTVVTCN